VHRSVDIVYCECVHYAGQPRFGQRPTNTQLLANWPSVIAWTLSDLSGPVVVWYRNGSYIRVSAGASYAPDLQLYDSTTIRRPFDCLSKVIEVTETSAAAELQSNASVTV